MNGCSAHMLNGQISVIVPVYNVINYLERCIDSLLAQTYKNIMIILIDDGSTDGSEQICDEYARKNNNIMVIHQKNQGLGCARNSGLQIANGEFIAFVDSDDWIDPNMYEIMHRELITYGCDIATCGRVIVKEGKKDKKLFCLNESKQLSTIEAIEKYLLQSEINMSACDKLFKRKLFQDIHFPSYYNSEDIVPVYKVLKRAKKIVLTGQPFYYYFYRASSITKTKYSDKRMGAYLYAKEVANDVRNAYPELSVCADCFEYDALLMIWRLMRRSKYHGNEKNTLFKEVKRNFRSIVNNDKLTKKHKIYAVLIILHIDRLFDKIYTKWRDKA